MPLPGICKRENSLLILWFKIDDSGGIISKAIEANPTLFQNVFVISQS